MSENYKRKVELLRHRVKTNSRNLNIRPFGDLQMGEAGFRRDLWNKWKKDALADKSSLIIGMGDYSDSFRETISKKLRSVLSSDMSYFAQQDAFLMEQMQKYSEELNPLKNRIIGLHCGHHHWQLRHGGCTCQYLCQLLRTKHLGFVAMTQLVINRGTDVHTLDIYSTHGCGGASTVNSDVANLERKIMPNWDADLYLRGHSTRAYCVEGQPLSYLSFRKTGDTELPSIRRKKRILVNTGGFMEGYIEGTQSYVERSNLPQVALGWCVVELNMNSDRDETIRINVRVETA